MSTKHSTRELIADDLLANTGRSGWRGLLAATVFEPSFATVLMHRLAVALQRAGHARTAKLLWRRNTRRSACHLHLDADIGPGLILPHPTGIVIGSGARLGRRVTIYQNVTLGRARREERYPVVGDGVVIYPNAVVSGGVAIGRGAVVGAGSVVVDDVPEGAVVAGQPARILRHTVVPLNTVERESA